MVGNTLEGRAVTPESNAFIQKNNYSYQDLLDCAHGLLFGKGNAQLPLPPMLMFDRITKINDNGGPNGKGEIEAERVRAQTNIERERDAAIEELRREFGGLAISAAEKVVKSTLDEEKNRELISSVLEENTVSK